MAKISSDLFSKFNIGLFSKYLQADLIEEYHRKDLRENNKRTRSDRKIYCYNMVIFILLWILNPEDGYLSVLNKVKGFLIKSTRNIQEITKSITEAGLCKARKRFSSEILRKIWQSQIIENYYKEKGLKLWKGFKVCAVDATSFTLNKSAEILKKFFLSKMSLLPKMMISVLYDVYTKIPLDIEFDNFPGDERGMLYRLIDRIKNNNTLLLLDRGYPAFWVLYKMIISKINFVIRVPASFNYKMIKRLGSNDWIVEIFLNKDIRRRSKKYLTPIEHCSLPTKIIVRLVKTQLKGFRPRFIITSLIDEKKYSYIEICKLYADRWIIENYYRDLKHILKIEKFHAKYVDGIYQEIYAAMILTIILQQYIVKASTEYNVNFYEISFKRTFRIISNFILLLECLPIIESTLENLVLSLIATNKQKKRPGRSYGRIFYRKIRTKSKSR